MSVGYKNPPEATRFKKRKPGNSRGRPKQADERRPASYWFRKVANEKIDLEDGTVLITRWEALIRQIHLKAYTDTSAARLLHQIRKQFPGDAETGEKSILVFSDNEMNY